MSILTVNGLSTTEKIIEKSRFITYSCHVESEDEAREILGKIRKEHSTATHVCYAFVADKKGNLMRFSDDGEPQGTAGMPILDVIRNKNLFETLVAVVRYFGGIKLGAGGLVRAYSSSASENLDSQTVYEIETCIFFDVKTNYNGIPVVQKFCETHPSEILETNYGEGVSFRVKVKEKDYLEFTEKLIDTMQGKVVVEKQFSDTSLFKV